MRALSKPTPPSAPKPFWTGMDGHVAAFSFLGGVPRSILYDNTKLAVARILGDGRRERTRSFAELQSHYLFLDRFGRPGKGNDKGKVEGLVGYARRNYLVPLPEVPSFAALNAYLEQRCLARLDDRLRGHTQSIGERLERDLDALQPLPASPYDPCDRRPARVSSLSLVRYDRNDYSVPTAYGHRPVLVRGYVGEVVIACGAEIIARHPRSYEREDFIFEPPAPGLGEHRRAWADAGDPRRGALALEGSHLVGLGGVPDLAQRDDVEPRIARAWLSQALGPPPSLCPEP